jgi:hypothetical protein
LATYCFFRESTVYYAHRAADRPVTVCDSMEQLGKFLGQPGHSYVITKSEYEPEIQARFAGRVRVIDRERRFLGNGDDMLVLRAEGDEGNATPFQAKSFPERVVQ